MTVESHYAPGGVFSFVSDSEASAPGLTDEMKNDVGSYMTRKIGTGRIDAYARLCLHDEVVQGNAVVPDVCC